MKWFTQYIYWVFRRKLTSLLSIAPTSVRRGSSFVSTCVRNAHEKNQRPIQSPAPATLDRVHGHLAMSMYAGILVTGLGRQMRGEMCGIDSRRMDYTEPRKLSARANECAVGLLLRLDLGCQPSTLSCVASQTGHTYHSVCRKTNATMSRVHARSDTSIARRAFLIFLPRDFLG